MQCYEEALKKIKNFNNSDINLLSILTQSKEFLTSQKEKPMDLEGNMELEKPTYIGASNPHELNFFVDILEKYKAGIEKRVIEFENELNGLNQEIEESYAGLRKIKYRLLSIMMHEGNAGSTLIKLLIKQFIRIRTLLFLYFRLSARFLEKIQRHQCDSSE